MQKSIFIVAMQDFLTKKFLAITFIPFVITFILFSLLLYGGWAEAFSILETLGKNPDAINDPNIAHFIQQHHFIASILSSSIFHYIFGAFFAIFGVLLVILLSTATATMIMGFFTPTIIKEIHKRHYSHIPIEGGIGAIEYIWLMIKIILKSLMLFIVSSILYFIPLFNAIALNIPFYYLFHSFLSLDVGGEIMSTSELQTLLKKYRIKIMSTTGILYLITLIPFAGTLLQVYFVSVMAHLFFRLKSTAK